VLKKLFWKRRKFATIWYTLSQSSESHLKFTLVKNRLFRKGLEGVKETHIKFKVILMTWLSTFLQFYNVYAGVFNHIYCLLFLYHEQYVSLNNIYKSILVRSQKFHFGFKFPNVNWTLVIVNFFLKIQFLSLAQLSIFRFRI